MDKNTENIFDKLPSDIKNSILRLPYKIRAEFEEIRIRCGQNICLISGGEEYCLNDGKEVTQGILEEILNRLLDYSYYAYEEQLSKGYITIEGGHRVGICGRVTLRDGKVHLIKDISSLNIRRSREIIGASNDLMSSVIDHKTGELSSMLIVSPPKCGKTTMIRDVARQLSLHGYKVGVCDERSEIAGCCGGKPSYDLGSRVDILDNCPKAEGIIMLIRSMSPDVIITDEIGKIEDVIAIENALSAGVKTITTIHGSTYEEIKSSVISKLITDGVFDTIVFLSAKPKTGTVTRIMRLNGKMKGE